MQASVRPELHNLNINSALWQVPEYEVTQFAPARTRYCLAIPVLNEGERIQAELDDLLLHGIFHKADIVILDGGSADGSTDPSFLQAHRVRALLVKKGAGKLSAQLRMGFAWAMQEGYEGVITVDGNHKDGIEAIPSFIRELDAGAGFVQGSRFIAGGQSINTPLIRLLAIRLLHAPLLSLSAGFWYTDTTNGFRAYSRRLLLDPRVHPFRNVFTSYELLAYISVRAPRTGHLTKEIPVTRRYPVHGVPTKISPIKGSLKLLKTLLMAAARQFDPKAGVPV